MTTITRGFLIVAAAAGAPSSGFVLRSPDVAAGGGFPKEYTADGGRGPRGDAIHILNFIRVVRDARGR